MRRSKVLLAAALLLVVSIVAPLLAGYCMNCYSGYCPPGCSLIYTGHKPSYCVACQLSDGTYACTACDWKIYLCMRGQQACSNPPYVWGLIYEENKRRIYPPFSCVWVESEKGYRCQ